MRKPRKPIEKGKCIVYLILFFDEENKQNQQQQQKKDSPIILIQFYFFPFVFTRKKNMSTYTIYNLQNFV